MKKFYLVFSGFVIGFSLLIGVYRKVAYEKKETSLFSKEEIQKMSKDIGHLLADTLQNYSPHYDFDLVVTTLREIEQGKEQVKPSEVCRMALMVGRHKILEEEARQNLLLAEQFLSNLAQKENVIEIKKNKLYYEILEQGKGTTIGKDSFPLLHFTETNLNHKVIRDTRADDRPIKLKLSETIAGFCQGVSGMQVGERRKIYVHPDLAYGKLSRQQLAIFDVEVKGE